MSSVLIVDDEPRITDFVQRGLVRLGLNIEVATDSRAALHRAIEEQFDLVVVDLMMPGLDGVELLRRLIQANPEQRVMVLSAISDVRSKVRCLEFGAVDYLAKPFDLEELAARINVHLRAERRASRSVRRSGHVEVDLERRTADAGTGAVALTSREFEVMLMLVDRHGEVCSRSELLGRVWGTDVVDGNVLEACVRRLRAKLGADAVETVRHVGYRLGRA